VEVAGLFEDALQGETNLCVLVKREIKERREAGYGDRLGFHAFTSADYFRFLMVRQSPPSCFVRSHESEHSGQLAGHDCPFPLLAFCRWG